MFTKVERNLLYDPVISFLVIFLTYMLEHVCQETWTKMSRATLFLIAEKWGIKPTCLSIL